MLHMLKIVVTWNVCLGLRFYETNVLVNVTKHSIKKHYIQLILNEKQAHLPLLAYCNLLTVKLLKDVFCFL